MISLYLHLEGHRLGPLWTTIDAQAAAPRPAPRHHQHRGGGGLTDRHLHYGRRPRHLLSQCPHHVFDPAPAFTDVDETRTVGLHEVAHAHKEGAVGLEGHGPEYLRAVLTCVALYGGSVHLATVPLDGSAVPVATESLYRVHYDWRCELVEDAEQRQIRHLNDMITTRAGAVADRPRQPV
ncbi:hypothetical protein [[Kitasatospora] papulosa]|uniref:hypothetical protein n=1 Tax=[Kitasatospora] papulosa TaxID=1464011 RepID=UPI00368850E8